MEMDEVNSSFSRLSLSPSFDWSFFSFFFSRLLLSMTRVGSLISFPRTLSLFGLSLSLSHSRSFPLCHVLLSCSLISPASFFLTRFWKPKEGIENRNEDIRLRKMVGRRKVYSSLARLSHFLFPCLLFSFLFLFIIRRRNGRIGAESSGKARDALSHHLLSFLVFIVLHLPISLSLSLPPFLSTSAHSLFRFSLPILFALMCIYISLSISISLSLSL